MPGPLAPLWFKSSYSGGSGTECVECAYTSEGTLVRDSKARTGPIVAVQSHAWRTFIRHLAQRA
ncbi:MULTISPECIES: DUF397 domain-containing protein [unclassified Streptomyces]|uniref:DUF397 domain-containing protein n=1 Tax=unclassified Streptomyces TaxID=2593676 RepID=UPI0038685498|nr:DUF397 domain-containing protein [Streptomyces sp. NBC_00827]